MEDMLSNIESTNLNSKTTGGIANESSIKVKFGGKDVIEAVNAIRTISNKIGIIEPIANQSFKCIHL